MEPATNDLVINNLLHYEFQDDDEQKEETDLLTQNMFSSGELCLEFGNIPGGKIFCWALGQLVPG